MQSVLSKQKILVTTLLIIVVLITALVPFMPAFVSHTNAAPNYQINYQGKLTNASNVAVADGTYNMRFWLLATNSIATTSAIWSEELIGANKVQVTNGIFSVMLGSTSPLTGVDFNQTLYLGVEIGGSTTPTWDGEMSPRKILGTVPAAFYAKDASTVGGVASTSFLRKDQADTASGLLTFTGGIVSNSSSTITNLTSLIATTTTLVINSESFTDFTGNGLLNIGSALTCATANSSTFGCLTSADWSSFNGKISSSSIDSESELEALLSGLDILTVTTDDITSSNLATLLSDETGSGNAVFNSNPLLQGFRSNASSTIGNGTGAGGLTIFGNSTTTGSVNIGGALNGTSGELVLEQDGLQVFRGLSNYGAAWADTQPTTFFQVGNSTANYRTLFTSQSGDPFSRLGFVSEGTIFSNFGYTKQPAPTAIMDIRTNTASSKILFLKATTSQSANIFEAQDASGNTLSVLTASGYFGLGTSSPSRLLTIQGGDMYLGGNLTATGTLTVSGFATMSYASTTGISGTNLNFTSATTSSLAITSITGSTQCLRISSTGVITGTGSDCASGAGDGVSNWSYNGTYLTPTTTTAGISLSGSSTIQNLTIINSTTTNATSTTFYTATLGLGTDYLTDLTGTSLVISNGALSVSTSTFFTNSSQFSSWLSDETGTGNVVFSASPTFTGTATFGNIASTFASSSYASTTGLTAGNAYVGNTLSIGTTSTQALLTMDKSGMTGAGVAGTKQYFGFVNSTLSALYYGDETYITNVPTATSTLVGKIIRIADTSALGNTVRGLEIQAHRGTNTKGENTGISAFGRTFGVKGTTEGDAGEVALPAGVFAETRGTTQGNALRAYSGTITTEELVSLFQDGSAFSGTGLQMNFGNAGGSFAATSTAKFLDLQVAGTSRFTITAGGTTTIGDGTTNTKAGLQIGYGGLCVDNDGSCTASTTGRITSVSLGSGNSDLAEMYFSNQSLHAGEIVALSGGLSIERAEESTKGNIIGVVSTKPGLLLGFDDTSLVGGESGYPVGLKGRVPIKLSTENGPIKKGDRIVLSSIPGVGMKATESSRVVGVALEDYDGTKAYTAGFLNQFGDDMARERLQPRTTNTDTRTQDGCYNGGGNELGEAGCTPEEMVSPIVALSRDMSRENTLRELAEESALEMTTPYGETTHIGQAIMFIELGWYAIDREALVLKELTSTSTFADSDETLWDRLKKLAESFVGGNLSVFEIKADKIDVRSELCVDGVCVTAEDLRALLQNARQDNSNRSNDDTSQGDTDSSVDGGDSGVGDDQTLDDSTEPPPEEPPVTDTSGNGELPPNESSPPENPEPESPPIESDEGV